MPKGLLHPKNAVESSSDSGFKEGFVKVDSSAFAVHQNRERKNKDTGAVTPGEIKFALVLNVTRLDEDQDPLKDQDDNDVTETLVFGLGKKALAQAHPGKADSPDDEDVEDLGDEVATEGPTISLVNPDFKLHKMTALAVFMESLSKAGWKDEYLDRVWAPDYTGSVFHMKTQIGENKMKGDDGKERDVTYKIVDKIVKAGYEAKSGGAGKAAAKTGKSAPAAAKSGKESGADAVAEKPAPAPAAASSSSSKNEVAEAAIKPILEAISEHKDGQRFSRKALVSMVNVAMQSGKVEETATGKVEPKQHVPVLTLLKDDAWMRKNAQKFDMTVDFDNNTVTFGTYTEE